MKIRLSFFIVLNVLHLSHAANILILEEVPSPSHHLWFKSITTALAAKGHNITVVSGDEDTSTNKVHYIHMEKVYETFSTSNPEEINFAELGSQSIVRELLDSSKYSIKVCSGFLKSSGWNILNNYPDDFKFDLIIHDYLLGGCLLKFMQKFKNVPLISMTAFNDNILLPSLVKSAAVPAINAYPYFRTPPSNFIERISNVVMHLADKLIYNFYVCPTLTGMVRIANDVNDTVSVCELSRRSILYLTNYDPVVDGLHQLLPNVIGVGGLQIKKPENLPMDLLNFIDNALDGVILFSLGSNIKSVQLGDRIISDILEVFKKFERYTFLWISDMEKLPEELPDNVFVRKWIPQNDVLAHENTKAFITHGGLLSVQEAIWHGVPMLGIPVFADQFANVHRCVNKGIARVLYLKNLTQKNLHKKLNSLLNNSKFRQNIEATSKAFRDQKEKPLKRAVWWIEWAIRNPNATHFKGYGQNLNFFQIESADVFAVLTIFFLSILWILLWISFKILKFIFLTRNKKSKKLKRK